MSSLEKSEPFPELPLSDSSPQEASSEACEPQVHDVRPQHVISVTGRQRQSRGQSLVQTFVTSNPPLGMWQATGEAGARIPTLPEIRDGSYGDDGWTPEGQLQRRGTDPHEIHRRVTKARSDSAAIRMRTTTRSRPFAPDLLPRTDAVQEEALSQKDLTSGKRDSEPLRCDVEDSNEKEVQVVNVLSSPSGPDETGMYPNGYRFPKKHTWSQSIAIGSKAFWNFFFTPVGFLLTIYGLNVVGWGAMIFFLLVEAAPAMCHPSCSDKYSARNVWIEIDAQVLTALFCVTAFGLIPWRFRDFYYLMKWRLGGRQDYHRKLAGIYRSWYRLPGSDRLPENIGPPPVEEDQDLEKIEGTPLFSAQEIRELEENPALPLPPKSIPDPPLTGFRAKATKSWNLDVVIWMYLMNTMIQAALCGIMWGLNRFNRPSWATGFLISIGCVTGIVAGIVVFIEGSKVKKVEGIPVKEYDVPETAEDYQKRRTKEEAKQQHKHGLSKVPA